MESKFLDLVTFIKQVILFVIALLVSHAVFITAVMKRKWFFRAVQAVAPEFHFQYRPVIYGLELITVWWCWVLVKYISLALFVNVSMLLAIKNGLFYESLEVYVFVVLIAAMGYLLSLISNSARIEAMLIAESNDVAHRYRWDRTRLHYTGHNWPQNVLLKKILSIADWVHQWNNGVLDRVMAHELQYPRRYNPDPESWPQEDLAFLDESANHSREIYLIPRDGF